MVSGMLIFILLFIDRGEKIQKKAGMTAWQDGYWVEAGRSPYQRRIDQHSAAYEAPNHSKGPTILDSLVLRL